MPEKRFKLQADEFRPLAPGLRGCFATDHITAEGLRVGYMYRERRDEAWDSGWRFFSGQESDEYANDPANLAIYDVNTIANLRPGDHPPARFPVRFRVREGRAIRALSRRDVLPAGGLTP
jgi:hypothetical protein